MSYSLTNKTYKIVDLPPEKYKRAKMLASGAVANINCHPSKPHKQEDLKENETGNT